MEKIIMDKYIEEFKRSKKYSSYADLMEALFGEDKDLKCRFKNQREYENPDYLEESFRNSVLSVEGNRANKDIAIQIYRDFYDFLKKKGISAKVTFPPIPVSNSFERHMFVAKFLHDPNRERDEQSDRDMLSDIDVLTKKLWVSSRTIEKSMQKLRGRDDDPIQVCNMPFKIPEKEIKRGKKKIKLESTAHPLFLTPNLTQIIVLLKGLKEMSADQRYANYAELTAAVIWKQLSEYAKDRIHYVLTEKILEDFTWYENLEDPNIELFLTEYACSVNRDIHDVIIYCLKNEKNFWVEVQDGDEYKIYRDCRSGHFGLTSDGLRCLTFIADEKKITVLDKNIIRCDCTRDETA